MGGDKGGKGGYKGGGKGDKGGGKGDKGGKGGKGGGKGGGGKGGGGKGPPVEMPIRFTEKSGGAADNVVQGFSFSDRAPRLSVEKPSRDVLTNLKQEFSKLMEKLPGAAEGDKGKKSEVVTSCIEMKFAPNTTMYQYDVKLTPEVKQRRRHITLVEEIMKNQYPGVECVVAGDIVYTSNELKDKDVAYKPTQDWAKQLSKEFKFVVKRTTEITTTKITQDVITIFSKIMKSTLDNSEFQRISRVYYDMNERRNIPGMRKYIVPGLYMTLTPAQTGSGLCITVDVVHKVISMDTCFEELQLDDKRNHRFLEGKVQDTIMMTTYDAKDKKKRTVHIDGVDTSKNENTKLDELKGMTMKEYVEKTYGEKVPPGQPLLVHKALRKNKDTGDMDTVTEYYLPSTLRVTGLAPQIGGTEIRKKMTEMCAVRPNERFKKIKSLTISFLKVFKPVGTKWGLTAQKGFLVANSRELENPTIEMSQGYTKKGTSWRFDIDRRPQNPTPTTGCIEVSRKLANILVMVPKRGEGTWKDIKRILNNSLSHFAGGKKIDFREQWVPEFSAKCVRSTVEEFGNKADMYLFVADKKDDGAYEEVKRATHSHGVASQVIKTETFTGSKTKSCANNVAAQMHVKRGNPLWKVQGCSFPDTMVVGIATHHPGDGAGRGAKCSIMGIASSTDNEMKDYYMQRVVLQAGATISKELQEPFNNALKEYHAANKSYPKEIVFLREGGSEGEIPLIMLEEIAKIKKCLQDMGVKAKVTFFLVLRNSHLRIASFTQGKDKDGSLIGTITSDGAPPSGTVIDNTVTHPKAFEFFLLAQVANIGSPCAVKYKCLHFEGEKLNPDKYERLANSLASMYYNWQGPIALPAPIMYAQKDAKMTGDCLLDGKNLVSSPAVTKARMPGL
eukprot:TRINITY_DN519_c1_g1_i3.p1 TRINITY_DN519_c1_g1~~TRINITY_DN519_c1_g1_i3.p1  ORF type:complete len:911 (+),score=248.10 TRINITY_DN519_c1_g1_i3:44-2734(+)